MQITSWAYGTQLTPERTAYIVYEGGLQTPKAKSFAVVLDKSVHLAWCLMCGHYDCSHAMFVQARLRRRA